MSNDPWADFKPDMDVPLPTDTRNSTSYPWEKFQVGASFFFQTDREDDTAKRLKNRLDQSTRTFAKKQQPPWKFTLRVKLEEVDKKEISGVRVWRIE